MAELEGTTLDLDLSALEHNYRYLRSKIRPDTKFLAVVKAFAYGSDVQAIAKKLELLGADALAVAYVAEGRSLREAGIKIPILVLHPLQANFGELIQHGLEPCLYSPRVLGEFLALAERLGRVDYPVHIKFNTGLNRLGFVGEHLPFLSKSLKHTPAIRPVSVFSHLAASEDPALREFSLEQIAAFERLSGSLAEALGQSPIRHMLNSSGILNYPQAQFEMVRSGIGLYGYGNHPAEDAKLRPVATLRTIISQIHELSPGQSVGYNRAYRAQGPIRTATLPLGHADGISRQYGQGRAHVLIKGRPAPILGNVCMDMIMVDVSEIDCGEGDEVIVFGPQNSADHFASRAGTISYELLTAISQRVKRRIIGS